MPKFFIGGLIESEDLGAALIALDKFKFSNLDLKVMHEKPNPKLIAAPRPHSAAKEGYLTLVDLLRPKVEAMAEQSTKITSKQITEICKAVGRAASSTWFGIEMLTKAGVLKRTDKGVYEIITAKDR